MRIWAKERTDFVYKIFPFILIDLLHAIKYNMGPPALLPPEGRCV
jgi:hypothetical protein